MKKYEISEVDTTSALHIDVKTKDGFNFTLPTSKYARSLKPGQKISVIHDNELGVCNVALIYNGYMELDDWLAPYANSGRWEYRDFLHDISWLDRRIMKFYATKQILAHGEIPHLCTWRNIRQFVRLNTR